MVQTTLKVDGMMCGMCESHVNEVVRKTAQVEKVTSSHTKGEPDSRLVELLDRCAISVKDVRIDIKKNKQNGKKN